MSPDRQERFDGGRSPVDGNEATKATRQCGTTRATGRATAARRPEQTYIGNEFPGDGER